VYDSAQVAESAQVYDSARVYGWAQVYDSARVSDHMAIDRPDGYVTLGPIGSEDRYATAAWDYQRREICVRAGCWYGSLAELEVRIAAADTWPEATAAQRRKWRTQYECLIAAASWIDPPTNWPEVPA
jgi:hypothetical protein